MLVLKCYGDILKLLEIDGLMVVLDLVECFGVLLEMICCDIKLFVESGVVLCMYGVVVLFLVFGEVLFEKCMCEMSVVKKKIVECVVCMIMDGESLMLDMGMIMSFLVCELLGYWWLMVIINFFDIVWVFVSVNGNCVYMVGGEIWLDSGVVFGFLVIEFIVWFLVDYVIILVGVVDLFGIFDYVLDEVEFV